ncbi:hypothetical protein QUB30_18865 [Microcoleus sp. BROC3]
MLKLQSSYIQDSQVNEMLKKVKTESGQWPWFTNNSLNPKTCQTLILRNTSTISPTIY